MPTVENPELTLETIDDKVTIIVDFKARFSHFERQLAGLGLKYHAHDDLVSVDNGTDIGPTIVSFPVEPFDELNTTTSGDQVIPKTLQMTVDRSTLQEDPDKGNADELKVKIRIHAPEAPVVFTDDVFTNQEILLG